MSGEVSGGDVEGEGREIGQNTTLTSAGAVNVDGDVGRSVRRRRCWR